MTVKNEDNVRAVTPVAPLHAIHVYDSEAEFAATVGTFVADGLRDREGVIVVATEPHAAAIAGRLVELGVDVDHASEDGALFLLDAAQTLNLFTTQGNPDPKRFNAAIGGIIRQAAAGRDRIRIFGEMVVVLWEAGQVTAAMRLEELWNELLIGTEVRLLCAYPVGCLGDDPDAAARLCELHGGLLGHSPPGPAATERRTATPLAIRSFQDTLPDARAARRFVVEVLNGSGLEHLVDDAAVVTAELATNAVRHAHSSFTVTVSRFAGGIEVAVRDDAPIPLRRGPSTTTSFGGRGLQLVAALSSRWGTQGVDTGKVVWAELNATAPAPLRWQVAPGAASLLAES